MDKPEYHVSVNNGYTIRSEMHQGKKHIVVPVVMLVEGVHNGSAGPVLHTQSEMEKFPNAWNGIPVVIGHPKSNGQYVSANSPNIIDQEVVGRVYNTVADNGKLKSEAWIEEERLKQLSPLAYAYIMQQKPLDVSVGVFSDDEETTGQWGDETYNAIARNYRPDHLALLPSEKGACSWEDGCGVRVNSENLLDTIALIRDKLYSMDTSGEYYYLEEVYDDGTFIYQVDSKEGKKYYKQSYQIKDGAALFGDDAEEVIKDVRYKKKINMNANAATDAEKKAQKARSKKYGIAIKKNNSNVTKPSKWANVPDSQWLDPVNYRYPVHDAAHTRNAAARWAQNKPGDYSAKEVGIIESRLKKAKKKFKIGEFKTQSYGGSTMGKIDELLTIAPGIYTDADKEWLEGLEDAQIDKLISCAKTNADTVTAMEAMKEEKEKLEREVETLKKGAPNVNEKDAMKILKDRLSDMKTFGELLPEELREQFEYGQKLYKEHRKELIDHIVANQAQDVWKAEDLEKQDMETLQKMAKAIKKPVSYAGVSGGVSANTETEILLPPDVEESK